MLVLQSVKLQASCFSFERSTSTTYKLVLCEIALLCFALFPLQCLTLTGHLLLVQPSVPDCFPQRHNVHWSLAQFGQLERPNNSNSAYHPRGRPPWKKHPFFGAVSKLLLPPARFLVNLFHFWQQQDVLLKKILNQIS